MSDANQAQVEGSGSLLARAPVRRFLRKALRNWLERHRHPFNYLIHIPGILLAVAGVVALFWLPWYWGLAFLAVGYLLQWLGHLVEGNDVGECAAIKRLLGLPYVGVALARQHQQKQ